MRRGTSGSRFRADGGCRAAAVRSGLCALAALALAVAPLALANAEELARSPQQLFFGFGTSKPGDLEAMKERGVDAVTSVQSRLAGRGFDGRVLLGFSGVGGATNRAPAALTRAALTNALADLRARLGTNDTVVIYSHTHGVKERFGRSGGLVLDDPAPGAVLSWPDYAAQLLALPAKTVVVLMMACHSGGLTDYLKTGPQVSGQLQARREQGRNFLVLTSQNAGSLSNPRRIEGEVVNPFTHAVRRALEGAADGYRSGRTDKAPDGRLTLGELAAYAVDEAKRHTRPDDAANDADPQVAGSFAPETVLAVLASAPPAAQHSLAPPREESQVRDVTLEGERWTCTADGKPLSGLLLKPAGDGPFPAIVLSHGLGGNAQTMMRMRGAELAKAGFVCIATDYTHAGAGGGRADRSGIDFTQAGARPENVRRGLACLELLRQRKDVDPQRIALYGHSMGAFLTIALAAAAPDKVAAAAITAGGVATADARMASAPTVEVADRVRAPFLILHGTADTTVLPQSSERLKQSLDRHGVPNSRHLFEGVGHGLPNEKSEEVSRLMREWFVRHSVLATAGGGRN